MPYDGDYPFASPSYSTWISRSRQRSRSSSARMAAERLQPLAPGPLQGREEPPGVLRRPEQVRRLPEALQLIRRDECHVPSPATMNDHSHPSLDHVVAKGGQVCPRVG